MFDFLDLSQTDFLKKIIGIVLIIVAGLILIRLITKITKKTLARTSLDESMHKFIISTIKVLLYIVMIVVLLGYLNVPTAPLVTVIGAAGAAIALALKDGLGNIAGGVLILANKPFKKGDVIDVAGTSGSVESIELFVTTLRTFDNKIVSVPNGTVTTSVIVNYSKEEIRRVDCIFGVSYDSDIVSAKDVLIAVANNCPGVLKDPPPFVGVTELQERAIMLDLKVWCETSKYFEIKYYLEEEVKKAFDKASITIPYPRMDVRVTK